MHVDALSSISFKTVRRLLFPLALAGIILCGVLLLNFTASNPTHRRYSSQTPLTTGQGTGAKIGQDAERILSKDLGIPVGVTYFVRTRFFPRFRTDVQSSQGTGKNSGNYEGEVMGFDDEFDYFRKVLADDKNAIDQNSVPPKTFYLSNAIRDDNRNPRLYLERAQLFIEDKKYDSALTDLDRASQLDPANIDVLLSRAYLYFLKGEPELAREDYDRVAKINGKVLAQPPETVNPNTISDVYVSCAKESASQDNFEQAIQYLETIVNIFPDRVSRYRKALYQLHVRASISNRETGQHDRAIAHITNAINYSRKSVQAYMLRADMFFDRSEWRKTIKDLTTAHRLDPDNHEILVFRGRVHECLNDHQSALRDYSAAIQQCDMCVEAFYFRAEIYVARQDFDKATVDFRSYLHLKGGEKYGDDAVIRERFEELERLRIDRNRANRPKFIQYRDKPTNQSKTYSGRCRHGVHEEKCSICASWAPFTYHIRWDD